jgi:hypothetical protein
MLTKNVFTQNKTHYVPHDFNTSSESESEHCKKQPGQANLNNISVQKKKIKYEEKKRKVSSKKINDPTYLLHANLDEEASAKNSDEFSPEVNVLEATDDDIDDSVIGLESGYTEIEVDSDSLSSKLSLKTPKINAHKKIEEKVNNAKAT